MEPIGLAGVSTVTPPNAVVDADLTAPGQSRVSSGGPQSFLEGLRALPTLPSVLFHFLGMLADPNASLQQLADFIWTDPALLARVIPLVGGAGLGRTLPAVPIRKRIALVGRDHLRSLAFTAPLLRCSETHGIGFNAITYWERSLWCAQACECMAQELGLATPEQYYIAGLMHDIGYLLFLKKEPLATQAIIEHWLARPSDLLEIEEQVMGIDHCRLGMQAAQTLHLAPRIQRAIAHHHAASPDSGWMERITCIGSAFCGYKGIDLFPLREIARARREREMEEILCTLIPDLPVEAPQQLIAAMEKATEHLTDWVRAVFVDFSTRGKTRESQ